MTAYLVTNITSSLDVLRKIDEIRFNTIQKRNNLHADIWWGERITSALDWSPDLWHAFPQLFPGGITPILGLATRQESEGLSRTLRLAIAHQHNKDRQVKFRQIELAKDLLDLFVDLEVRIALDSDNDSPPLSNNISRRDRHTIMPSRFHPTRLRPVPDSALRLLLDDDIAFDRILLEGGPGQGKSTVTQMAAQIYREKFLRNRESQKRDSSWHRLCRLRVPIRLELREFAQWLSERPDSSLDEYIAGQLSRASGGASVSVDDLHSLLQRSSVILMLDGLDEVGNDPLRDRVLDAALEAIERIERALKADIKVVLTTRPPAVAGRLGKLNRFVRVVLAPMRSDRIDDYLDRWLGAQIESADDRARIRRSFNTRRQDKHVEALAHNPMQLSVLLQFISLKGEAFPDRRAELYRDYFQIVIDRDVEKSRELRDHRELIESLHSFLGFRLHGEAEVEQGGRSLSRSEIINLAGQWLEEEGHPRDLAGQYFALGEERFGLIVALSGEGHETTYGFEVQPIQEYFAAAYISNRLPNGKAHDVFERLICKGYWREVALFLAGLRRPNEKADLIGRAKDADEEAASQWLKSGRTIILDLLLEGVLSHPKNVQREAIRFVAEFLDLEVLRLHQSPAALIDGLSDIGRLYNNLEMRARVTTLVGQLSQSNDYDLVVSIHRLAANILPKEEYIPLVLNYSGTSSDIRAAVRFTIPLRTPEILIELGKHQSYWDGISVSELARHIWFSVVRGDSVPEIAVPLGLHSDLIFQFAIGDFRAGHPDGLLKFGSQPVFSIWKLLQNTQMIHHLVAAALIDDREQMDVLLEGRLTDSQLLWSDGGSEPLSSTLAGPLRELIRASDDAISLLAVGGAPKSQRSQGLAEYVNVILKHLNGSGIVSWISCQCGTEVLFSEMDSGGTLFDSPWKRSLASSLEEFYGRRARYFPDFGDMINRVPYGMPTAVRMCAGESPKSLALVVSDLILGRLTSSEVNQLNWLRQIPLSPSMIRRLVESCRFHLEELLRFIGSHPAPRAMSGYSGRRLLVQDTQRILKICRNSTDDEILRGAAILLEHATFSRLAEMQLVEKMITAAPSSRLGDNLFEPVLRGGKRGDQRHIDRGREVASFVLEEPHKYPFRSVNLAAEVAAGESVTVSVPLFVECPELKAPNQIP